MIARRVLQVVKGVAFIGSLVLLRAYAQEPGGKQVAQVKKMVEKQKAAPGQPGVPEAAKEEMTDALSMPTDRKAEKSIQAAQDLIKEEKWGEAASILQKLLESKEDIFVEVERRTKGPDGKEQVTRQRTSLRVEANRLLGTMPTKGLEFYELQNGARAATVFSYGRRHRGDQSARHLPLGPRRLSHGRFIFRAAAQSSFGRQAF